MNLQQLRGRRARLIAELVAVRLKVPVDLRRSHRVITDLDDTELAITAIAESSECETGVANRAKDESTD